MKTILQILFEHKTLTTQQAKDVLIDIGRGNCNEHEITAFMTVYLMRTITIDELIGFREALLELSHKISFNDDETIDIVGTGGDGKNTFNISTLACFIVAGSGQKVTKHGNYGATSVSGSSNVMEKLGYHFKNDASALQKELDESNICFLHAPLFHPALKIVAPIRKNLGVRTFFNMLGPLVNPSSPSAQMIGVYNLEMARIYSYLLQQSGARFCIIHGLDGYDEISLTNDTKLINNEGEFLLTPQYLGKRTVQASDLYGGNTVDEAAKIFINIITGKGTWAQNAVVLANAATALHCTGKFSAYDDAYHTAIESLESGKAYQSLQSLLQIQ